MDEVVRVEMLSWHVVNKEVTELLGSSCLLVPSTEYRVPSTELRTMSAHRKMREHAVSAAETFTARSAVNLLPQSDSVSGTWHRETSAFENTVNPRLQGNLPVAIKPTPGAISSDFKSTGTAKRTVLQPQKTTVIMIASYNCHNNI